MGRRCRLTHLRRREEGWLAPLCEERPLHVKSLITPPIFVQPCFSRHPLYETVNFSAMKPETFHFFPQKDSKAPPNRCATSRSISASDGSHPVATKPAYFRANTLPITWRECSHL